MKFTFVDLFAGIGGFHQALKSLGGECVFASEIDEACKKTYSNQFGIDVHGDINESLRYIPKFDVLCGGFPCQTFSKAGKQEGFSDDIKGKLFFRIIQILKEHKECKYVILENVRNLADNTEFWRTIQNELENLNFFITREPIILSPDDFGIPQNRERVYILGIKKNIANKEIKKAREIKKEDLELDGLYRQCDDNEALRILEYDSSNSKLIINKQEEKIIKCWEEFKKRIASNTQIGCPFWLDSFGIGFNSNEESFKKKYDFYYQKKKNGETVETPEWKKTFIMKNRKFYLSKKNDIDAWYKKYENILNNKTYRKFEWNCGAEYKNFKKCIIQFRQSGIRVKRLDKFPSLVAIVNTPIIWDETLKAFRRISIREAANLQSFDKNFIFLGDESVIYKQLGNAVNVDLIKYIARGLFNLEKKEVHHGKKD